MPVLKMTAFQRCAAHANVRTHVHTQAGHCNLKVWGESTPFTVGSVLYLLGAWGSLWMWKSQVPAFLFQYLGACRRRTPRAPVPHLEGT